MMATLSGRLMQIERGIIARIIIPAQQLDDGALLKSLECPNRTPDATPRDPIASQTRD